MCLDWLHMAGGCRKGGVVSRARVCRWQRVELEASLEVLVQMGETEAGSFLSHMGS